MRRNLWPLLLAVAAAGCGAGPSNALPPHAARPVRTLAQWRVLEQGSPAGRVVLLQIEDPSGPLRFYRVEDAQGRWLGHASDIGRFSRRVPFASEEEDLGVLPMARGVALLLEATVPVQLEPIVAEADARREPATPR